MKDLFAVSDLSQDDLLLLLELADESRHHQFVARRLLRNENVLLWFARPSPRARLAATAAVTRLGGTPVHLGSGELQPRRGETVRDMAGLIAGFCRAVIVRDPDDAFVQHLAAVSPIPVVNAGTDKHEPLLALADLAVLRRHFGSLAGLRVAFVGPGGARAASLVDACALAGVDVAVATPPGFDLEAPVVERAETVSSQTGSLVMTVHDPYKAVAGAHAVVTTRWPDHDAADAALAPYRVDEALMDMADPSAVFLHALPATRGREVDAAVIDGRQSLVFEQIDDRLPVNAAVLRAVIGRRLHGRQRLASWAESA